MTRLNCSFERVSTRKQRRFVICAQQASHVRVRVCTSLCAHTQVSMRVCVYVSHVAAHLSQLRC